SSLLAEASWTRQPPVEPDMFSIRLAMLVPPSLAGGVVLGAWVTVGALGGGVGVGAVASGVAPGVAGAVPLAVWSGVGVLFASGSLGAVGSGMPPGGS